ncbi:Heat shock protein beta-2, partial [Ophiophagus hannah]
MAQQHSLPHAYPMSPECEFANPSKIYDQNFGEGKLERGISEVTLNEHKFQVFLDVCQFTPDEIAVRTVDNLLEVTAQHPQKVDRHGFISREFTRTYILPLDVDPFSVKATVTHDGILSIEVRRTGKALKAKINEVEVTCQGQPERKEGSQERPQIPKTSF